MNTVRVSTPPHKFPIGFKFIMRPTNKISEVVDLYTTYDTHGRVVDIQYQCVHTFAGQEVYTLQGETTVARGGLKMQGVSSVSDLDLTVE